ncbi:hypothetical protein KIL84_011585 [Mauremys mutica]|uniref:Uncharacterized protein n=1 Tax=Mauremys mutica TaxID=74926 RepID=A0A9D4B169_9SAUR|nr:hypothetical protein KIL84_011585 [Mauremys mutica]
MLGWIFGEGASRRSVLWFTEGWTGPWQSSLIKGQHGTAVPQGKCTVSIVTVRITTGSLLPLFFHTGNNLPQPFYWHTSLPPRAGSLTLAGMLREEPVPTPPCPPASEGVWPLLSPLYRGWGYRYPIQVNTRAYTYMQLS